MTQAQTDVHDRAYSGSNNRSKTEAVSAPLNPDSKHFNCLHVNMYRCKCVVCAACVFVCVSMYTDKKGPKKSLKKSIFLKTAIQHVPAEKKSTNMKLKLVMHLAIPAQLPDPLGEERKGAICHVYIYIYKCICQ